MAMCYYVVFNYSFCSLRDTRTYIPQIIVSAYSTSTVWDPLSASLFTKRNCRRGYLVRLITNISLKNDSHFKTKQTEKYTFHSIIPVALENFFFLHSIQNF